jgi:hypothetical protein
MPDMICRKASGGRGVLRVAAFASSSASAFLFLSMYSTMKPLKKNPFFLPEPGIFEDGLSRDAFFFYLSDDHRGICAKDAPLNVDAP